ICVRFWSVADIYLLLCLRNSGPRTRVSFTVERDWSVSHGSKNIRSNRWDHFCGGSLAPLLRAYMGWPVVISDWAVPMWLSWIGFLVAGGLAYFGLNLARHH